MSSIEREKEMISDLVAMIKAAGFRAFVAERGTYGFFTNAAGSRVISFGIDLGAITFSGNYKTNQPSQTGTGWMIGRTCDIQTSSFEALIDHYPPRWAVGDAKWQFTSLEQHLKTYQESSRYKEA